MLISIELVIFQGGVDPIYPTLDRRKHCLLSMCIFFLHLPSRPCRITWFEYYHAHIG